MSPERWHEKNHSGRSLEDCWQCWRQRDICRSKRRFATWERAEEMADEARRRLDFAQPIQRYRCRWCLGWHLTSHPGRAGLKRHEKMRRKALQTAKVNG